MQSMASVVISILDQNDNYPRFTSLFYEGHVSESAPVGSLVLTNNSQPLVMSALDADSGLNSLLHFELLDTSISRLFSVDSNTGKFGA